MVSQQAFTDGEGGSDIVSSDSYLCSVNQSNSPDFLAGDRSVEVLGRLREPKGPIALLFFP